LRKRARKQAGKDMLIMDIQMAVEIPGTKPVKPSRVSVRGIHQKGNVRCSCVIKP
jgi:hypothetical protein